MKVMESWLPVASLDSIDFLKIVKYWKGEIRFGHSIDNWTLIANIGFILEMAEIRWPFNWFEWFDLKMSALHLKSR